MGLGVHYFQTNPFTEPWTKHGMSRVPWTASAFDLLDDFLKPFPSGDLSVSRSLSSNQVSNGAAEGQNWAKWSVEKTKHDQTSDILALISTALW